MRLDKWRFIQFLKWTSASARSLGEAKEVDPDRRRRLSAIDAILNKFTSNPASNIRLVGGHTSYEGNLEVRLRNGSAWGAICDDSWDEQDAEMACRTLGFQGSMGSTTLSYFGDTSEDYNLDEVRCKGREQDFFQCSHLPFGLHNCEKGEIAGVRCIPDIRLRGSKNIREGRVEINYNGDWGTICDDSWDISDAGVVCRMIGYPNATAAPMAARFGPGEGEIILDEVRCEGSERTVQSCPHKGFLEQNCDHGEDASVICDLSKMKFRINCNGDNYSSY
ncbi:deleted in malignant brain tumors 1 protein [Strongylocentrotus purpuratus]|uniref:SRCR domain-containing protein n=1 Tax=Strongylocentrotus purpuratus TaxID=7668 RepID=A0A7M7HR19_STRPU|nr:deleted in malignant brain tumors 1 protein [Strongylocentrotus purpuratus]|eukprot:XP_011682257.1 PREDICTED: deleted in malignant brain tumors 1 protein [Strongylocentrotus purpuratus]